ncbi:NACHT domain-containing protein [Streptomyces sp. NPDC005898]|uniref:NACHT domain-containing protein n=1 Tax=Streptomyces sp. NPDC005898 TaxID=3157082 RepID=UPI0033C8C25A
MPDPITSGVASSAGSAAGRVVAPALLRGARAQLERRAVKKRAANIDFDGAGEIRAALADISAADRAKILEFTKSSEFENICYEVAVVGCMPKKPADHLAVLKETFEVSLRRYSRVEDAKIRTVANALFNEVVAVSWKEVARHQGDSSIAKRALTPELISSHISAAARNAEIHQRLSDLSVIDQYASRLAQQCARIHGRLRPAQTESGTRVRFESLYVEPSLTFGDTEIDDTSDDVEDFSDARTLLKQAGRLVVLGDPGGGKTTLALKLTLDVARGRGIGPASQTPLRVVLRDYANHYKHAQESIIEFLEKKSKADYSTPAPEGAIDYLLLNGRAVVIFDGLDELTDTSLRMSIVDAVEAFAHAYPSAPILVTSRKVGYEMAPLDDGLFVTSYLAPFTPTQQQNYVNKWFSQVRGSIEERKMADRFLVESRHAADLTSNPLMLGLMCALYRGEGYIPRNRPDLYRRCSEFLFERWDASRGISVPQPFERGIQFAMFSLALSMLRNSHKGGMTERELIRYTSNYLLGQQYEDHDSADAAAEAFVKYCRGRAWVLTDVGTNPDGERIYSFTHRTFLEYFSARQLVRDSGNAEGLYRELRTQLMDESWDVTAQLAVQFLDERLVDAANDFVRLALSEARGTAAAIQQAALVSFCARLLEYLVLRPAVVREIVDALCTLTDTLSTNEGKPQISNPLSGAWSGVCMCTSEIRSIVNDVALNYARKAPLSFDRVKFAVGMSELVPRHASPEVRTYWSEQDRENAKALPLLQFSRTDPRAAVSAVLFGILGISDALDWHGTELVAVQEIVPDFASRGPRNLIYELGYPRLRWKSENSDRIACEVVDALIAMRTPWIKGRQNFITYSNLLPDSGSVAACRLLSWMLGVEMETPSDPDEDDPDDGFGTHELFACVAAMRRNGVKDARFVKYRKMFSREFYDFVLRWSMRDISLSTGEGWE